MIPNKEGSFNSWFWMLNEQNLHKYCIEISKAWLYEISRKYLRDAERLHYSRLALDYCLSAIKNRLPDIREMQDREKAIKLLMETYKSYNYCISKMKSTVGPRISNLLAATFKAVVKEEVSLHLLTLNELNLNFIVNFISFYLKKKTSFLYIDQRFKHSLLFVGIIWQTIAWSSSQVLSALPPTECSPKTGRNSGTIMINTICDSS